MCNRCGGNHKNFFITTDADGKMPALERGRVPTRPYYVQYVNDKPVVVAPYFTQDKVWDYSRREFLALHPSVKRYNGEPMPMYTGRVLSE